ncbi:MAG: response regulator, partial [Acidobacteriota bacterium]
LRRDLPSVEVDPQQLRQVLVHLVANAVEAARDDVGMVMLRTGVVEATRKTFDGAAQGDHLPAGRYTFVEVSDDGVGMDEVTRDRMFEPFFSTKSSGRGLGLAAVSGIVRAHAGAIKVYSQPGRGTTVEVLLPAMVHRVASGVTGRPAAAWEADGCALVIDDEDMVREVALRTLQRQGFEVMSAGSGAEGLELLDARAGEVRLVLLDFTMPEMNGDEVFRRIREHDGDVKVIMMSGWRDADASLLDRLDGFLSKPFRANELAEKVREVLAAT